MQLSIRTGVSVIALAAVALASPAFGQAEPVELASLDQPTIIVTGEKFERTLLETTTSVEVLTGEELEERGIDDLYDAVLRTPNVSQSFGEKGFTIRGIDQRLGSGGGLLINTIVDGASLPNNQSTFFGPYSAWDVGQIEILRGPQGTTQGRNAIGGAIIINSAEPVLGEWSGRARISYAELNTYQIAGALNVPIGNTLALRVSADQRESDGWVFNPIRNEDYDRRESFTGRASLLWRPSPEFTARHTFSYTDSEGGEDLVDPAFLPDDRFNFANGPGREGSEHIINTLRLDWEPSDAITVTSLSTYYIHNYVREEDFDNTPLDAGALIRNQDDDSFVQEIRLRYDDGGPFRALVGAYYGTFDNQSVDSFFIPTSFVSPRLPPGTVFQDRTFSTQEENIAIFGEIEWDVIDAVTLILGARYDDESRDFTALSTTTSDPQLPPGFLPLDELIENSTSYDAFLPKFGVRFNLSDYVTLGATVQRAYRAGGTDVAIVSGEINEFDPEYTWNYEMSVRAQTPDNSFAVQGNVFYTKWTDQIVEQITLFGQTNGVPIDTLAVNAGESEVYGFELSMEARPSRTLDTFLSLGYVHTEFTDFVTATGELAGNRFNNASPFTVSAGFDWEHPTGFRVLGDVNLRDGFFSVIDNDPARITTEPILGPGGAVVGQFERCEFNPCNDPRTRVEAAVVVNLRAGYEAETWSIYAFARNLLDEDYITQRNAPNNFSPLGLVRTGEPRVLGVEFNVSFGG